MNVTLISLDRELQCFGLRTLSSCLRKAGHSTRLVFMVPREPENAANKFRVAYTEGLLAQVRDLVAGSDLIGFSLMSNQFVQAVTVTQYLKTNGIACPIIWGGVQPTVEPEECLGFADAVCRGEGEEALVELVGRMGVNQPYLDTRNMWFNTPDGTARNPLRPLIRDLDEVPFPDYSCIHHFVVLEDSLEVLTKEKFLTFQGERFRGDGTSIPYMCMTSRGCPYSCTYCGNAAYRDLYPGQKLLRWRSDRNIVNELQTIRRDLAPLSYVYMVDDNFTARSKDKLKTFCDLYKKEIGIPFYAQVSPLTISEEKMDMLFDAGCSHITMGVETASSRVAGMYDRTKEHAVLHSAIALVENYRPRMSPPPTYQFIIDNPYETVYEMCETLRLAASFPRPWHNPIYSLMLFPGVPLYRKALEEGIITDKYDQIYTRNWRSQSKPFFQFWIRLYHANVSPLLLRWLLIRWVAGALSSPLASALWRMRVFRWLWDNPT
jgi:anaerobic magnesium-protoporphyrin IX monomethyl ester cyclase